jgi:hypothetical protein
MGGVVMCWLPYIVLTGLYSVDIVLAALHDYHQQMASDS